MNQRGLDWWKRVNELLNAALERAPEARKAFLDDACDDEAIRDEVELLLAEMDAADDSGFLDQPVGAHAGALAQEAFDLDSDSSAPPWEGRRIGPFEVVRELGRGGMGAVYLAERVDGEFEQQVALKVIKRGMDTDHVLQRFYNERQILAQLEHPNIARLHDGGMTEDGLPYFVMEYVDGEPITEYCNAGRLSVDDRLDLFVQVCDAVQYAHQNLIVHRDLKPSNILVTDDGTVKLLDFGIAKLLSKEDRVPITQTGMRVLTPRYAAPEQVRGGVVTTATDVYALGLVLYELLTGHRPYRIDRHVQSEIERVVCEVEPVRPSTAVRSVQEVERPDGRTDTITPETVSAARSSRAARLRRRLRGDLDTIVLMALRKEPERRYPSAEALREDVRRHRSGQTVTAQPDTLAYRAKKFVGRHRWGVGTTVLIVFILMGFTFQVMQERDRAQTEAEKAEQVTEFLISLFDASNPYAAAESPEDMRVADLLDAAEQELQAESPRNPLVQATLFHTLGRVNNRLSRYEKADSFLTRAHTVRHRLLPEDHPDLYHSYDAWAHHYLTQVATYRSASMLHASTNRKTFSSKPRAVTA
jgi:serine/threonine-protein kinase